MTTPSASTPRPTATMPSDDDVGAELGVDRPTRSRSVTRPRRRLGQAGRESQHAIVRLRWRSVTHDSCRDRRGGASTRDHAHRYRRRQGQGTAGSRRRTDLALRVAVRPGGCSGFSYEMFFDGDVAADDEKATFGNPAQVKSSSTRRRRSCSRAPRSTTRTASTRPALDHQPERHPHLRLRPELQLIPALAALAQASNLSSSSSSSD